MFHVRRTLDLAVRLMKRLGRSFKIDGFNQMVNVKVIMATNRADTLDRELLRPARLDRKIEFPLPNIGEKRLVLQNWRGDSRRRTSLASSFCCPDTVSVTQQCFAFALKTLHFCRVF